MHPALYEKIARAIGDIESAPDNLRQLLEVVDEAFRQLEEERALLQRSMDLTSEELLESNQKLQNDNLQRRRAEAALKRYAQRVATLREIDRAILTAKSTAEISLAALERLCSLLECKRGSVALIDYKAGEVYSVCVFRDDAKDEIPPYRFPLGDSPLRNDLRRGRSFIEHDLNEIANLTAYERMLVEEDVRSYLTVPLLARDHLIGMINLASTAPGAFQEEQAEIAREVADELAVAVQQSALLEEVQRLNENLEQRIRERTAQLERRAHEITLLNETAELMQSCVSLEEAYAVVAQQMPALFPGSDGALGVLSEDGACLSFSAVWGDAYVKDEEYDRDDCWALRRGHIHLVEDARPGMVCTHAEGVVGLASHSLLCVPMTVQSEVIGVLHLRIPRPANVGAPLVSSLPESEEVDFVPGSEYILARQQLAQTVTEQIGMALANLKLRETLRMQAIRDPLTGLYNRRYMEESLARETRRIGRSGGQMGVIMLDIDDFKEYNDRYGHAVGDVLLESLGEFLRTKIRQEDIACKYGGEEFVLILPDAALETTRERAEYLRQAAKELRPVYEGKIFENVTLSLGVSQFPDHGATWEEVLRSADMALYKAKSHSKDLVMVAERPYPPRQKGKDAAEG